MLFEVAVQVGLLSEAAVAQVTFERLFFVVDVANMTLQVGGDTEGSVAVFTSVERVVFFLLQQLIK